ncbi:MAG TPA: adenylosuccinate lyase [Chloroflexota bacterium]|nr:adenylosuccinate lyase [Chloroflexota bacterium]
MTNPVRRLTPLDGRYDRQIEGLRDAFSEYALIRERVRVEVEWLIAMGGEPSIADVRPLNEEEQRLARSLVEQFDEDSALRVKEIERTTNHDVKAVEYFLRERLKGTSLEALSEFVHFACTSEDINGNAYALMLKRGVSQEWLPLAEQLVGDVTRLAREHAATAVLTHTHGQPASPSTLGKELAVFAYRWQRQLRLVRSQEYLGKFAGAVGSFNAHAIAYPNAPWPEISRRFVEGLGLTWNPLTTQIEPHDYMAELFHAVSRFNTILLDFDRDMWSYISLGYFRQKVVASEVGSSTMPHKVNPIDFENSEANVGIANALFEHLATKLPVSRLQRDLSDSSALRNMGVAFGHSVVALHSARRGVSKVSVDHEALERALDDEWEVLGEAIQTVMRRLGHPGAYERMKELTRGTAVTQKGLERFIKSLGLPAEDEGRLLALTPASYVGRSAELVEYLER